MDGEGQDSSVVQVTVIVVAERTNLKGKLCVVCTILCFTIISTNENREYLLLDISKSNTNSYW